MFVSRMQRRDMCFFSGDRVTTATMVRVMMMVMINLWTCICYMMPTIALNKAHITVP